MKHKEVKYAIAKAIAGGLILGLANGSWGGIQYFSIPISLFFIALPFFRRDLTTHVCRNCIYSINTDNCCSIFTTWNIICARSTWPSNDGWYCLLVIAYFVRKISRPMVQTRNVAFALIAFVAIGIAFVASRAYVSPSFRYLNAINPFIGSIDPLVESVAEHFTPTVADYFTDFSVLLMFAGLGGWLAFRRRNDTAIFALLLGITGVYVSATFARLVFASVGIIVLAGLGLYEVTRSIMAYRETTCNPNSTPRLTAATREKGERWNLRVGHILLPDR